jgi:hypothetical protein
MLQNEYIVKRYRKLISTEMKKKVGFFNWYNQAIARLGFGAVSSVDPIPFQVEKGVEMIPRRIKA